MFSHVRALAIFILRGNLFYYRQKNILHTFSIFRKFDSLQQTLINYSPKQKRSISQLYSCIQHYRYDGCAQARQG